MPDNPSDSTKEVVVEKSPKSHTFIIAGLAAGLVIALAGDGYLAMKSNDLQDAIAKVDEGAHTQISKLGEATTARIDEQQKQWDDAVAQKVKGVNDNATAAIRRARAEADKKSEELSRQIADTHSAVDTELSELKDTTSNKITEVSTPNRECEVVLISGEIHKCAGSSLSPPENLVSTIPRYRKVWIEFGIIGP
jgi:uncharacterized phage infection (PIP) family protein YhgE